MPAMLDSCIVHHAVYKLSNKAALRHTIVSISALRATEIQHYARPAQAD